MWYVQAHGDTFLRHIFDNEPTQWDENNFCYARQLTPEQAERFGVYKKQIITPPHYNPASQTREEGPAKLIDGVWTQTYIVADLAPEEAAERVAAQWSIIREERNRLLTSTDWWVTKAAETGETISPAQYTYRQALRDITEQPNPFHIVWPQAPQ